MTDEMFCKKIAREVLKNIFKTEQMLSLDRIQYMRGIYIPYPKKRYFRIERNIDNINEILKKENLCIKLEDEKKKEVHVIKL